MMRFCYVDDEWSGRSRSQSLDHLSCDHVSFQLNNDFIHEREGCVIARFSRRKTKFALRKWPRRKQTQITIRSRKFKFSFTAEITLSLPNSTDYIVKRVCNHLVNMRSADNSSSQWPRGFLFQSIYMFGTTTAEVTLLCSI